VCVLIGLVAVSGEGTRRDLWVSGRLAGRSARMTSPSCGREGSSSTARPIRPCFSDQSSKHCDGSAAAALLETSWAVFQRAGIDPHAASWLAGRRLRRHLRKRLRRWFLGGSDDLPVMPRRALDDRGIGSYRVHFWFPRAGAQHDTRVSSSAVAVQSCVPARSTGNASLLLQVA